MGRAAAVAALLACLVALTACGGGGRRPPRTTTSGAAPVAGARPQPNVVLVLTDDLSTDLLRFMPHVRSLERRGTRFSRYVVSDSLCCPSRASIFTGRYPHDTGVFTNEGQDGGYVAWLRGRNDRSTFATSLQRAGYRTGLLGKYINGYDPKRVGAVPPGWDSWAVTNEGYGEYDYVLNVDGHPEFHRRTPADYLTSVLQRQALGFLDRRRTDTRPFLLEVATFAPHSPAVPAPRDVGRFPGLRAPRDAAFDASTSDAPSWLAPRTRLTRGQLASLDALYRRRARSVLAVDRMIGALEDRLEALGVAQDTYVVFSSDNGFHTGQHRLTPGKLTAFDHDVRVPLVIAGKGVARGRTEGAVVQNVDLRPTFEALGGARTPGDVDGRSLVGLLADRPDRRPWRTGALVEHHGPDLDPDDPDEQSTSSGEPTTYEALRTRDATYVEYRDGQRELYDDRRDPAQLRNVVRTADPAFVAALHAELRRLATCHGAACAQPAP